MPVSESYFGVTGFAFPVVEGDGGVCDYPATGDVRDGVSYGSGLYTGTVELPSEPNVRSGIGYGASGTEFTGTLSVPSSRTPRMSSAGVSVRSLAAAARAAIVARAEEYAWTLDAASVFDYLGDTPFPSYLNPPFVFVAWGPPRPLQHSGAGRLARPAYRTFWFGIVTRYMVDVSGQSTLAMEDDTNNPDHSHDQWESLVLDALDGKMLFDDDGVLLTREPNQWSDAGSGPKAPDMRPGWHYSRLAFDISYNQSLTEDTAYGG